MNKEGLEKLLQIIEAQGMIGDRYSDPKRITEKAGDGHFSLVFKAKDCRTAKKREVALKFLNPDFLGDEYATKCFHREVRLLNDLRGQRNILPLVDGLNELQIKVKDEVTGIQILFPLLYHVTPLAKCNIREYIVSGKTTYLKNILFFGEMCKAVQRLHNRDICHRDLRPNNFLLMKLRYVCVSDLGFARYFNQEESGLKEYYSVPVGDKRYVAPELLCGLHFSKEHNFYGDIFSLGAILFELFSKSPLGPELFTFYDRIQIINDFSRIPEAERIKVVDGVISTLAESRKLPSVKEYDDAIPKAIAFQIDRIYQGMAALDYRKREKNFNRIFIQLEIAKKVIQHEMKILKKVKERSEKKLKPGGDIKC